MNAKPVARVPSPPQHATDFVAAGADMAFEKTEFDKLIAALELWKL